MVTDFLFPFPADLQRINRFPRGLSLDLNLMIPKTLGSSFPRPHGELRTAHKLFDQNREP